MMKTVSIKWNNVSSHDHQSQSYICRPAHPVVFISNPLLWLPYWLACFIDSSRRVDHHSPMCFLAATKDRFVIVGIPSVAMDSCNGAWPPPVDIWPHAAVRLLSQYWPPVGSLTQTDMEKENSVWQPAQHVVIIDASPSSHSSLTDIKWSWGALCSQGGQVATCWAITCKCSCSCCNLIILLSFAVLLSTTVLSVFLAGTLIFRYLCHVKCVCQLSSLCYPLFTAI